MNAAPDSDRIHTLSPHLANQIAAGEVVERPASVVKELLENGLDAGARRIEVDVEQGGARLVRVRDDGQGIHPDDLALALTSHATSKISHARDLERIVSLGFRGEALPSIAAVSRLTLTSRYRGQEQGWRIEGDGPAAPAAHPQGTTVEVRDLFYNTPARRKFLRTEKTEFGHLQEVVRRMALSRTDLALVLRHQGRQVLALRAAQDAEGEARRVAAVCGGAFMEQALAVDLRVQGLHLHGWLAPAAFSRAQADLQFFYLNGRTVRDKLISHAVRQAYADRLYPGRHPAYVLYLEMAPDQADVNVHPTKHEVRFREARLVHDFIHRTLTRVLEQDAGGAQGSAPMQAMPGCAHPLAASGRPGPRNVREAAERYGLLLGAGAEREPGTTAADSPPLGYALGQIGSHYLVAENRDGLVLVDLPAAGAEVARDKIGAGVRDGPLASQPLLLPSSMQVGEAAAEAAESRADIIGRHGFDLTRNGPDSVTVHRIPSLLRSADPRALVRDLLLALVAATPQAPEARVLDALAGHGVPGAARRLTLEEMNALLRDLERLQAPAGERCRVVLDGADLEQLFTRGRAGA